MNQALGLVFHGLLCALLAILAASGVAALALYLANRYLEKKGWG